MPKVVLIGLSAFALATAGACSSQSDDDGLGTGGRINVGQGGGVNVGGGSSNGKLDGGHITLTPPQVTSIKTGSCAGSAIEGEAQPSVIELVIDTSSSMNERATGTGNRSKWEVTREALLEAIVGGTGPGLPAAVGVGLLFYPNKVAQINRSPGTVNDCVNTGSALAPALLGGATAPHRQSVQAAISQVQLQSSTPSHDAYKWAFENGISRTNVPGRRFMLLITDGQPTLSLGCTNPSGQLQAVDAAPIVDEIRRTAAAGIKTFLIGSPGSENNRRWMSQAAVIGGTSTPNCQVNGPNWCHMDMTETPDFSAALRAGLAQISGQLASCDYEFPPPPPGQSISSDKINVVLTSNSGSELVVRDNMGDCQKGWQLTSDNRVHLCADTCQAVQSNPNMKVDILFGCASLDMPPT